MDFLFCAGDDEAYEILQNMMVQESSYYARINVPSESVTEFQAEAVDGAWRQRIIEWMYGVVDHCNLRRDSVAVAAYFLDVCTSKGLVKDRKDFQLVAMTSLMLAIKLYESTLVKLDSMVKLGRGLFTEQDVVDTEAKILKTLEWRVHPPTTTCFMRQLIRLLPKHTSTIAKYKVVEVTRFIAEISTCLQKFVPFPASKLSMGAVLLAMDRVDATLLSADDREQFLRNVKAAIDIDLTDLELLRAIDSLKQTLRNNCNLHDLLITIDAQCQATQSVQSPQETPLSKMSTGNTSPREVSADMTD